VGDPAQEKKQGWLIKQLIHHVAVYRYPSRLMGMQLQ
jgi:hypothetical protein